MPPQQVVVGLSTGFWVSQMLLVATRLGIADLLKDEPRSAADLAGSVDANPEALYRLLRALASVGVLREEDGKFQCTPVGACLQSGVPGSMRAWVLAIADEHFWRIWPELMYSVKTGEPGYDHAQGMGVFEYFARNPEKGKVFDEAMTSFSSLEIPAVVSAYDFSGIGKLVDVAGGYGSLLCAVLKANPGPRGVLFDMPSVIEGSRKAIEAEGLSARCEVAGGDFFASVPAGADAYMMKHIIHDWDDARCIRILENCRKAMNAGGKVLIVDTVLKPGNDPDFFKILDLGMLMISGRERTEQQFRDLLARAGFRLTRVVPTESAVSVVEGVPV